MLCSDRALSHPQAKPQKRERQQARVLSNSGKSEHMLDRDREKRSSVLFQDGESDAQTWRRRSMLSEDGERGEKLTWSLSLGKYLRVGKLCTLTSSISLAVESILAMTTSSLSLNFSPSSSQMGASCLQCPHQGASVEEQWMIFNNGQSSPSGKSWCCIPVSAVVTLVV